MYERVLTVIAVVVIVFRLSLGRIIATIAALLRPFSKSEIALVTGRLGRGYTVTRLLPSLKRRNLTLNRSNNQHLAMYKIALKLKKET